ncbi:MAG: hypothetical protein COB60_07190 [Flavobacteriaceae bacterium]|nr:MAG: hypothetical protein COB60_07190 [Flavobacteriaceae bacterium]
MWIKTQNNKELVDVSSIKIVKSGKKAYIMAVINGAGFWLSGDTIIGKYGTMDEAILALNKIETSISNRENIHVMSTN